jgi:hypothetical protein
MGKPDTYSIIISKILKNVKNKVKWKCLSENCNNYSIKSHLLQQKGILNNISTDDNHLREMRMVDYVKSQRAMIELKKSELNKLFHYHYFVTHVIQTFLNQ